MHAVPLSCSVAPPGPRGAPERLRPPHVDPGRGGGPGTGKTARTAGWNEPGARVVRGRGGGHADRPRPRPPHRRQRHRFSRSRCHSTYGEERFPVTEKPAVRLRIRDEPAVSWELALSEGEDARLLLDGHAYGFGTDSATGSVADAAAWETLSGKVRRHHEEQDDDACVSLGDGHIRAVDETTGSDLVTFCTGGDGTWPVWLGRSAAGDVVSVLVITSYL
ncbi:DUF4241 domain-containing protein [Streptomyces caelestis]|uniref:DUF4241 domain-containing protein n=1 Tax=Streptomyces caelestis TaxID=36816 RepID=UPI00365F39AB